MIFQAILHCAWRHNAAVITVRPITFFPGWLAAPRSVTGNITLNGSIAPMPGSRAYDLTMLVQNLPLQPIVEFARRVKKNVPTDIVAAGRMDASVTLRRSATATGAGPVWMGSGEMLALNVRSPLTNTRLALDKIPFTIDSSSSDDRGMKPGAERSHGSTIPPRMDPRMDVGPFSLALGRTSSATVRGQFSRSGYNLLVQGDAESTTPAGSGAHDWIAGAPALSQRRGPDQSSRWRRLGRICRPPQ